MVEPYTTVQIGCGQRGQTHAEALSTSDRFTLSAVCDIDADAAERTADTYGVATVYTDLETALDQESPDTVVLVTPATVREEVIRAVLAFEPPSLVFEKPVATTFDEVTAIAALVEAHETETIVCHQHIYGEELQALKGWIDDGRLGAVERVVGTTKGGLYEHGTHFVHKINWLLDAVPDTVRADLTWGDHFLDDWHADVEPTDALLELTYPDDRRVFLHMGTDAPDVPAQAETFWLEYRLDVIGTDGHGQFVLGNHAACRDGTDGYERHEVPGFDPAGQSSAALYTHLAALLAGEIDQHPSSFSTALDAHRVLEAAVRSDELGPPVGVDPLS